MVAPVPDQMILQQCFDVVWELYSELQECCDKMQETNQPLQARTASNSTIMKDTTNYT